MMINLLRFLALTVFTISLCFTLTVDKVSPNTDCPPNHMEFVSLDTLGAQDDLKLTFASIKDKIKLNTVPPVTVDNNECSIY